MPHQPTMRVATRRHLATLMTAAAVTGLTGCAAPQDEPLASPATPNESAVLVVEPLDQIAGSQRVSEAGVGLDLPVGWSTDRSDSEQASVIRLFEGAATNPVAALTVGGQPGANADAVQVALDGASDAWGAQALGPSRVDVAWPGMPDAAAVTFSYEDLNGGDALLDAIIVAAHDDEQTRVVLVLATAPHGALESSAAYEVLRTLRFDS